ncbi:MAG: hypothetical protein JSV75_02930 [Candidatus Bathyarchaeota archaeon]|nr:MAG: hypothetical protein JSV75_02930 [Candidatus Bathyarchaeota archaeon]
MSEFLTPIVSQLGTGGIGGFLLGYLIKKVLKIALIIGCFALIFFYLAFDQVIEVNYAQLLARVGEIASTASQYVSPLLSNFAFSGSLMLGVLAGFMLG